MTNLFTLSVLCNGFCIEQDHLVFLILNLIIPILLTKTFKVNTWFSVPFESIASVVHLSKPSFLFHLLCRREIPRGEVSIRDISEFDNKKIPGAP